MPSPKDPFKFEEYRKKQRAAQLGRKHPGRKSMSEETREKIRVANRGRKYHGRKSISEEAREKKRAANLGKQYSEEEREEFCGEKNPMFGKHHSEEARIKQSCAKQGIPISEFDGFVHQSPYCELWNGEFRERVLGFFGYVCMYPGCEKTQEEEGRRLSVHHVNYDKQTCCRENEEVSSRKFVTLCNRHNLAVNYDRELWERYFIDLINNEYEGRCYFTKEEWAWLNGVMWWRYENNF
jgi:hypothetical protein